MEAMKISEAISLLTGIEKQYGNVRLCCAASVDPETLCRISSIDAENDGRGNWECIARVTNADKLRPQYEED